ncbi:hypothetical protein EDC04DRAFT_2612370 [Pisolithus marmoratus]|nr:hypothetical protein EDC04DRAFT_2612370 [Pisolithus marmoratus]
MNLGVLSTPPRSTATVLYKSKSASPNSKRAMLKRKVDDDGFRLQYQNMCPACHEKEECAACSEPMPYFTVQGNTVLASNEPTFINGVCERASKSQRIIYATWRLSSTLAQVVKLRLWRSEAESLAATIGEDIFQQKIFFISVHSKVTRGDLFAGKEGDGSDVAVRPEELHSVQSILSVRSFKSFIVAFGVRVVIQGHDLGEVFKDLLDVSVELPHAY